MEKTIHVAALDLGTSKIIGMVARKNEEGTISILASEQIPSDNCIRRGYVSHVEETTHKISTLLGKLNSKLPSSIERMYIGIGGQSIHSIPHTVKKNVPGGIVSQDILSSLEEEAWDFQIDSLDVLDVVSPEYYLDGQLESNPKGAACTAIEAHFQLIVGRSTLKKHLISITELRAKLGNAGFLISPLATAEAVLTEREKELGCALAEFGAGVTYLSIYKGGLLRYLVTIPLGGEVITKDLRSLNILESSEAEGLKIDRTSFLLETNEENGRINDVIEARMEEILENVIQQIKESGYVQSLGCGIVITGGASQLKNIPEFIRKKTGKEVRLANPDRKLSNPATDLGQYPNNACVIGLLSLGTEECLKEIEVPKVEKEAPVVEEGKDMFGNDLKKKPTKTEKPPKPPKPPKDNPLKKWGQKITDFSNDLFDPK